MREDRKGGRENVWECDIDWGETAKEFLEEGLNDLRGSENA